MTFSMKKVVFKQLQFFVFISLLLATVNVEFVKADESTLYIRADGSIEGTDSIQRVGNVYAFVANIEGLIVVEKDDIVIDGAGFTLQGSGYSEEKGIYLAFRNNVTVCNVEVTGYRECILLENTTNSKIIQNKLSTYVWEDGIRLDNSSNNLISNNNITSYAELPNSQPIGVYLQQSPKNTISSNNITGAFISLCIGSSNHNIVTRNNITLGLTSILLSGDSNQIFENNIFGTVEAIASGVTANYGVGILISATVSPDYNKIYRNNLFDNRIAVQIKTASHNVFYQNNFFDNEIQVNIREEFVNTNNTWNYNNKGNYWDDYTGTDANGDGIGDTPYIINLDNQDNYPLMEPVIIPEVPSWLIVPMFLIASLIVAAFKKRVSHSLSAT